MILFSCLFVMCFMWNIKRATHVGRLSSLVARLVSFFPQGLKNSFLEYR